MTDGRFSRDSDGAARTLSGAAAGPEPQTSVSPDDEELAPGTVVGQRYRVLRKLGHGGMGCVYEAVHITIEKPVALKVLHPAFAADPIQRERFLREARAAARVGHRNIVGITDFGEADGIVFIAMELLRGTDLARVVKEGPLPWPRARSLLLQICDALAMAHGRGIVHRDMKLENVFLTVRDDGQEQVKIVDFGIAKLLHDQNQPRLTAAGVVYGTPGFIAPEQIRGGTVDHRADVYAVGVVAYQLLTGVPPFRGANLMQVLMQQLSGSPAAPSTVVRDLPPGLDAVVLGAMAVDSADRPASMDQLARQFNALGEPLSVEPPVASPSDAHTPVSHAPGDAPTPTLRVRSRRGRGVAIAAVVLVGVVGGMGVVLLQQEPVRPPAQPAVVVHRPPDAATAIVVDAAAPADVSPPDRSVSPVHPRRRRRVAPRRKGTAAPAPAPVPAPKVEGELIDPYGGAPGR